MTEYQTAGIVAACGLAYAAWVSSPLRVALASRSWPKAKGAVIETKTLTAVTMPDSGRFGAWAALDPFVLVEYQVDGETFRTSRVRWTGMTLGQARLARQRYRPGAMVDVHYDPRQPGRAVLEAGTTPEGIVQVLAGLLVAVVAAAWMLGTR